MGQGLSDNAQPALSAAEATHLPVVPHVVYAELAHHVYGGIDCPDLPEGWSVFLSCEELCLNREGYYATAYINESIRHCIIAQRGTVDLDGLRAGVCILFDEPNIQFALAEQFSKQVRLKLQLSREAASVENADEPHYHVSYTGHSLGAVLAACRACAENTFAVTFESPGCRSYLEKTLRPFRVEEADIVTYLRPPNPINTLKQHAGYLIQLPPDERPLPPVPSKSQWGQSFLRNQFASFATTPEVWNTLCAVEPVLRDLADHTRQSHSMSGIVSEIRKQGELAGKDAVVVWPSNPMQYVEYAKVSQALQTGTNEPNVRAAFESHMAQFYCTVPRSEQRIPLRYVSSDTLALLQLARSHKAKQWREIGLSKFDVRVISTLTVGDDSLVSDVVTALEAKQYLSLLTATPQIRRFLDTHANVSTKSKL